jgi:hypothetical protein
MLMGTASYAQDGGVKVRERMQEYLQKRLNLSKSEADRFAPVFLEYFNELRKTNMQYRGDKLVLQQKIVDLRLRYREQFKPIMGEKRSNDVFVYEHDFVDEVKRIREERIQNRIENKPAKRF